MRSAFLILQKDLRQRVRDRSVWLFGIVAPLALAGVLGSIIGGFTADEFPPPAWGVVDLDQGELAQSFTADVLPAVGADLDATITSLAGRAEAVEALDAGDLDAVFVLPADLTSSVQGLGEPEIEVLGRISQPIQQTVAVAIAERWAREVDVRRGAVLSALARGAPIDPATLDVADLESDEVIAIESLGAADRTLDGPTYVSAGMAVFFMFFTVQLGVVGLLEERTAGTLGRLRAAPVPSWTILLGKILTSLVIGWVATVVLLAGTSLMLGASWGPLLPVLVLVTAATLAAVSLVTVVAGFAGSADAANNAQGVIAIVLGMLGGAFFPIATEPGLLATLSDLTPHGMFLTALGDLAVPGAGLADITPQLLGLLAFGAAVAAGGSSFARMRELG